MEEEAKMATTTTPVEQGRDAAAANALADAVGALDFAAPRSDAAATSGPPAATHDDRAALMVIFER